MPRDNNETALDWYYLRGGQTLGPVAETSIRAWLESGFLKRTDLLWRSGLSDWTPAWQLPEFGGPAGGPAGGPPPAPGWPPSPVRHEADRVQVGAPSLASFWARLAAAVLDWTLLSTVLFLVLRPQIPEVTTVEEMRSALEVMQSNRLLVAVSILLPWVYFTLLESSSWQATLGKKLLRLRVVDSVGQRIGLGRAALRHLLKVVLMDLTIFISFLPAAFTPRKQALHDMIVGTLVIRE